MWTEDGDMGAISLEVELQQGEGDSPGRVGKAAN